MPGDRCTPPAESVTITSPADGAMLTTPVAVMITSTYACECTVDCCYEDDPMSVSLIVDGTDQLPCEDLANCMHSVDFEESGEHVLRAVAQYATHTESTPEITITVEVPSSTTSGGDTTTGPSTTGPATSTGTGTDTDAGADGGDSGGGCSCRTDVTPSAPGALACLLLLGAGLTRRRR
jgi:MYXO-CTERM domain-containing protein